MMLIIGQTQACVGAGVYEKSMYLPLNFVINLKLLFKKACFFFSFLNNCTSAVATVLLYISNNGFPGGSAGKESTCNAADPQLNSCVAKFPWRRNRSPTPVFLGFPGGSDSKESTCNVGALGSIPGLGRSPGGGHGNPLQYSCRANPMDRGAWQATGYSPWGCKESDTIEQLSTAQHTSNNQKPKLI